MPGNNADSDRGSIGLADPAEETRRFKIVKGGDIAADGVVLPPPTCMTIVVWRGDRKMVRYPDLRVLLEEHGDDIVWKDHVHDDPTDVDDAFPASRDAASTDD